MLALKAGLDPAQVVEALSAGAAQSWVLANRSGRMLANDYPLGFRVALHLKDLGIALDLARETRGVLPVAALAAQLEAGLVATGHADDDMSALARAIRVALRARRVGRSRAPARRRYPVPMHYELFMGAALGEARAALERGERPHGAAAVLGDALVASGHEEVAARNDPTAHAVIVTLREAAQRLGTRSLAGVTIFATVEPCPMCVGALLEADADCLVYALPGPRLGGGRLRGPAGQQPGPPAPGRPHQRDPPRRGRRAAGGCGRSPRLTLDAAAAGRRRPSPPTGARFPSGAALLSSAAERCPSG